MRTRTLVGLVVVLAVALAGPAGSGLAQESSPAATSGAIPASPVGIQLTWILDQLNGDAADLTEPEITERFAPEFLAGFLPAPALIEILRQTAQDAAPVTFAGFAVPPTDISAVALIDTPAEAMMGNVAIYLAVEPMPPHQITRLDLAEEPKPMSATGRRVSIGDRSLYLDCTGEGQPTVVLEGGIVEDWAAVQPAAAAATRVCGYDRPDSPGSRSDPTPARNAQQVVDDLHAVLAASGEPGPYLLVGHSMGGLYVQLYAYQHPAEVAGVVLVDPTPEDFSSRLAEMLTGLGTPVPDPSTIEPLSLEEVTFAQVREARTQSEFPAVPVIVITHGLADDPSMRPPGWPMEEEERIFRELHEELVAMFPGAQLIVADQSRHNIHMEQPLIVVDAILQVVAAIGGEGDAAIPDGSPVATPGG